MYHICTCPHCRKPIVEVVSFDCIENHLFESGEDVHKYIVKNVKINTAAGNEDIVLKLVSALEATISDDALLKEVLQNIRNVLDDMI